MILTICDRCGAKTTGVPSGHLMGIDDADEQGSGNVTKDADVCAACYAEWLAWLKAGRVLAAKKARCRESKR
jgi:hypothetical protein